MEACFVSSNSSFVASNADQILLSPSIRPRIVPFLTKKRNFFRPSLGRSDSAVRSPSLLVTRCQLGSESQSLRDDDDGEETRKPLPDWRSFRARLVTSEKSDDKESFSFSSSSSSLTMDPSIDVPIDDKWAHTIYEPEKGCILVATEKLDGVHIFERTVILLLSTGPVGPTGIILNRPSLMSIKEMKSTASLDAVGAFADRPLFFGGPLEEEGVFLVSGCSSSEVGKSGVFEEVMDGLYYGRKESVGCAAEMVKREVVDAGNFRFFDGYCGWDKDQLRDEIRAGYWTVAACSPNVIGGAANICASGAGLWEELLSLMGPTKKVS